MTDGAPIDAQVDLTWVKSMWIKVGKKFGGILRQDWPSEVIHTKNHTKSWKSSEIPKRKIKEFRVRKSTKSGHHPGPTWIQIVIEPLTEI